MAGHLLAPSTLLPVLSGQWTPQLVWTPYSSQKALLQQEIYLILPVSALRSIVSTQTEESLLSPFLFSSKYFSRVRCSETFPICVLPFQFKSIFLLISYHPFAGNIILVTTSVFIVFTRDVTRYITNVNTGVICICVWPCSEFYGSCYLMRVRSRL